MINLEITKDVTIRMEGLQGSVSFKVLPNNRGFVVLLVTDDEIKDDTITHVVLFTKKSNAAQN